MVAAFLAALVAGAISTDRAAALAHRASLPVEDQPFAFYATTEGVHPEGQESAAIAFKLAMASASPSEVLEHCVPQNLTPSLMWFDLRAMQFSTTDWHRIVSRDPYRQAQHTGIPLCSGADWLTVQISDAKAVPDAYYPLVFGGVTPKTQAEALAILRVDSTPGLRVAMIEGASGVSQNPAGVRFIENLPISRGSAWGTRDVLSMESHKDPLERLDGTFEFDGAEWIIHRRKISLRTHNEGALACYFLANGKGQIVNAAPIDLVEDHTEFRGKPEIVAPGSCISCHQRGYNLPSVNALVDENLAGVDRFAKYADQLTIEKTLYANLEKHFTRGNEDYATACIDGLGVKPVTAAASFQLCVSRYDEPVTLETAARELYTTPERLRQVIALESGRPGNKMTTRVAGLAHGLKIPREAFEEAWQALWFILQKWEAPK